MLVIAKLIRIIPRGINKIRFINTATDCNDSKKGFPEKVFSGIQPTGSVHLGNYLGAVSQWVRLQNAGANAIFSIVDLHSVTLPQDPKELSKNILDVTAILLACGIDPAKSILFQQSLVYQHLELCWHLSCISTMARLSHLSQYKEKSAALKDVPLGLFIYPVLQAADILLYKATQIPVGEDQAQHMHLVQELAKMFNKRYGYTFPIPHALILDEGSSRIKSLRDPMKKMSKSDPDVKSRISLTDSDDDIINKVKKSVSDFTSNISFDPIARPGISNLINIHSMLSGKTINDICTEAEGLDTLKYKMLVAENIISHLTPIRERLQELIKEPQYLVDVLYDGADRATEIAEVTMKEVRDRLGLNLKNKCYNEIRKINVKIK